MSAPLTQPLRTDAQENRDRVLAAARELFAEVGLDVTMRQIARHAGVGPATLYRRFPTKQDLVREAFQDEMRACRAIAEDSAADPDPWRGLCHAVEGLLVLNAENQGFTDAFLSSYPTAVDLVGHRTDLARRIAGLARRAQEAGRLRPDFVFDDFLLVLHAGRGLAALPPAVRAGSARRLAAIALEGLRADRPGRPLPPPARLGPATIGDAGAPAARRDAAVDVPSGPFGRDHRRVGM